MRGQSQVPSKTEAIAELKEILQITVLTQDTIDRVVGLKEFLND